ncbi:FRG domain-containing protein [Leptospira adleri]|uniref:FRG domain-containing protein n=1 Tax=Leptospira adleri TaxID=2023186 RepID=UPI001083D535|nr:FRG domain-containing protein [Leptospira adleri]TGM58546.1 FRG domain-containing protein [Leptospira adleri]
MGTEINSVADYTNLIFSNSFQSEIFLDTKINPYYSGIWFRGESEVGRLLLPALFRGNDKKKIDETSVVREFKRRFPQFSINHKDSYDWLCLMQHYGISTRLLDFSESPIVALYFAVQKENKFDKDGAVIVLNSMRLNAATSLFDKVALPSVPVVRLRAKLSEINNINQLSIYNSDFTYLAQLALNYQCLKENNYLPDSQDKDFIKDSIELGHYLDNCNNEEIAEKYPEIFSLPVATAPSHLNERLIAQSGTFIIFGGKGLRYSTNIPAPILIEDIDAKLSMMKKIIIPSESKLRIRNELKVLGIHEGVLYPELSFRARQIEETWTFPI